MWLRFESVASTTSIVGVVRIVVVVEGGLVTAIVVVHAILEPPPSIGIVPATL